MTRRDEVLVASVSVLAEGGMKGLTHRAVDIEAGLPRGTTSNYFRNRHALVIGTLEKVADVLAEIIAHVTEVPIRSVDDVIETLGNNLASALEGRIFSAATAALFTEAHIDESLSASVLATNRRWRQAIEGMLRAAGIADQVELRASCLLSYGNGLVVDQLALRDPDFDAVAAMRLGVEGFCR